MSHNGGHAPDSRRFLAAVTDGLLEATIAGSFSRLGFAVRSRTEEWSAPPRLEGMVIMVTGASSGIGQAAALGLARLGASLVLIGRDEVRLVATRRSALACGAGPVVVAAVDLVEPDAVASLAERMAQAPGKLDGLVHCAGALFGEYRTARDGTELTLATHVLAPFRLSALLFPLLRQASSSVIVTVSSGGMYTQRFDLDHLETGERGYRGATAYARAKRAQVVLAREWSRRWGPEGISSYAMHPGWVQTPGLTTGLPSFARLGPLLRTPRQGADTVVWLAATGRHAPASERPDGIWLDRRRRSAYYLPTTYRGPLGRQSDGEALWDWCLRRTPLVASLAR